MPLRVRADVGEGCEADQLVAGQRLALCVLGRLDEAQPLGEELPSRLVGDVEQLCEVPPGVAKPEVAVRIDDLRADIERRARSELSEHRFKCGVARLPVVERQDERP